MTQNSFDEVGTEGKVLHLTAADLVAAGVPLSLSHDALLPYQHNGDEHTATCRAWMGRQVLLRTGHVVALGLLCRQASQLLGFVLERATLGGEEQLIEEVCFVAAKRRAAGNVTTARHWLESAERDAATTRRDGYHYEEVAERRRRELAEAETVLGDLLYDEAVKAARVAVGVAA